MTGTGTNIGDVGAGAAWAWAGGGWPGAAMAGIDGLLPLWLAGKRDLI
jgi:hypothetical protein